MTQCSESSYPGADCSGFILMMKKKACFLQRASRPCYCVTLVFVAGISRPYCPLWLRSSSDPLLAHCYHGAPSLPKQTEGLAGPTATLQLQIQLVIIVAAMVMVFTFWLLLRFPSPVLLRMQLQSLGQFTETSHSPKLDRPAITKRQPSTGQN